MARFVKLVGMLMVLLLGTLGGLLWYLQTQLTPETIRDKLLPLVEQRLQRKIDFATVDISLWKGISVTDLTVGGKQPGTQLMTVAAAQLRYQLWSLLSGQLVLNRIELLQPHIYLSRSAAGTLNIADLLSRPGATAGPAILDSPASDIDDSTGMFLPLRLVIKQVDISAGEVVFVDRLRNAQTPYRFQLREVALRARKITHDQPFPVELSMQFNGARLDLSANYDLRSRSGDLTLKLTPLDLSPFAPYYRPLMPGRTNAGRMAANLELELDKGQLLSRGHLSLEELDLNLPSLVDAPLAGMTVGVDYALNYDSAHRLLEVSTLLVEHNGLNLDIQGQVDLSRSTPVVRAEVDLKKLDLRQFMLDFPGAVTARWQKYSPAGVIAGNINLQGTAGQGLTMIRSAQLELQDVKASLGNLRAGLTGSLDFRGGELKSDDLQFSYGDQQVAITFQTDSLAARPIVGTFSLHTPELDLNRLLVEDSQDNQSIRRNAAAGGAEQPNAGNLARPVGPFALPLSFQGEVNVERLLYRQLSLEKLYAVVALVDNRINIEQISARTAEGPLEGGAMVDLNVPGPASRGHLQVRQSNIRPLLAALWPSSAFSLSGDLRWSEQFALQGIRKEDILATLDLQGDFAIGQGRLEGSLLGTELARLIGLEEFRDLQFQTLTGQYRGRNGRLQLSAQLLADQLELRPQGLLDLRGPLNIGLNAKLAPELLAGLEERPWLRTLLRDERGWALVPLRLGGTWQQPRLSLDRESLRQQALTGTQQAVQEQLRGQASPGTAEGKPMKELLDRTLDRLFGQ